MKSTIFFKITISYVWLICVRMYKLSHRDYGVSQVFPLFSPTSKAHRDMPNVLIMLYILSKHT